MEPVTAERGYMASAEAFLHSFELLAASGDQHARALALVGGFIVECLLKAYLVHAAEKSGEHGEVLREHDLQSLWSKVEQTGLSIPPVAPVWCAVLNGLHYGNKDPRNEGGNMTVPVERRYPLRYQSTMNGLAFPIASEMRTGVLKLFDLVSRAITA
jgi:hypothetical protein